MLPTGETSGPETLGDTRVQVTSSDNGSNPRTSSYHFGDFGQVIVLFCAFTPSFANGGNHGS